MKTFAFSSTISSSSSSSSSSSPVCSSYEKLFSLLLAVFAADFHISFLLFLPGKPPRVGKVFNFKFTLPSLRKSDFHINICVRLYSRAPPCVYNNKVTCVSILIEYTEISHLVTLTLFHFSNLFLYFCCKPFKGLNRR